ncbi:MAG: alpha/beta hydrolase [Ilumatobacteraceae bacterium]
MDVRSADGTPVALHELAGTAGPDHPVVLVAHATGFHGRAYGPVARHLAPRFHTFGVDFRGHGDTPSAVTDVDWERYGDDALAAADVLTAQPGARAGLVGFGHSMGGAALLMAARRSPELFRLLVLFEPIVFDEEVSRDGVGDMLADGARRRRPAFASVDAAIANYASKPPMATFDPEALEAYVRDGVRPDGDGVRLKCEPAYEAATFERGRSHRTWDHLGEIQVPVVIAAGRIDDPPSRIASSIAERLPRGRLVLDSSLDHFGPFTDPATMAGFVTDAVDALDDIDPG